MKLAGPGRPAAAIAAVVACAASMPVAAQVTPARSDAADRRSIAVTIYNAGMALVREVREVDLPAGTVELAFEDVAARVRPETVRVRDTAVAGAARVVEQNYRWDAIAPASLIDRYVGRRIDLVQVVPGTGETLRQEATLLSTGGPVLGSRPFGDDVYDIGGDVTFGGPWRIVLPPEVPEGLVARPTLFWLLDSPRAGRRVVEASYLTWGMTWRADYVLLLAPDGRGGDLTGWVTINNDAGIPFHGAALRLVAGHVNVVADEGRGRDTFNLRGARMRTLSMEASAPAFVQEGMFEYHLYTLGRPTDLADREQKQIEMLRGSGIPVERTYRLCGQVHWFAAAQHGLMENLHPDVWVEFVNAERAGLGMPLPAGTVRVYQGEAGRRGGRQFVGEGTIPHTPREERVKLRVGSAFDVVAERRQIDHDVLADGVVETEWEVRIRNRKPEPVVVEVREPTHGDWEVRSSSVPHVKVSAREVRFDVACRPDEEAVLRYVLRVRY